MAIASAGRRKHTEGQIAKSIESQTAKLPSDTFLWAAITAIGASATLQMMGRQSWSADGSAIYFTSDNGGLINLWSISFDRARGRPSGAPRRETAFTGPAAQLLPDIRALEVGLGRNRVVLPVVEQTGGVWISERRP